MTDAQKLQLIEDAYTQWFEGLLTRKEAMRKIGDVLTGEISEVLAEAK